MRAGAVTRVLIADDHAVVRRGLKEIIAETPDMVVAGEAASGEEVLERLKEGEYDLLVLDITMPGRNGLDILKELKTEWPDLPVLILSIHPEEQYAVRALKSGASGYLTKESAPEELITALRKVSEGRKYISASLAERLLRTSAADQKKPLHERLSNREYQVMCLIASGKTVKEIAEELSLSVKTISTYRNRILEKMNMKNNAEIIHYALKYRLVHF